MCEASGSRRGPGSSSGSAQRRFGGSPSAKVAKSGPADPSRHSSTEHLDLLSMPTVGSVPGYGVGGGAASGESRWTKVAPQLPVRRGWETRHLELVRTGQFALVCHPPSTPPPPRPSRLSMAFGDVDCPLKTNDPAEPRGENSREICTPVTMVSADCRRQPTER
jgi:hypothetical protein